MTDGKRAALRTWQRREGTEQRQPEDLCHPQSTAEEGHPKRGLAARRPGRLHGEKREEREG